MIDCEQSQQIALSRNEKQLIWELEGLQQVANDSNGLQQIAISSN